MNNNDIYKGYKDEEANDIQNQSMNSVADYIVPDSVVQKSKKSNKWFFRGFYFLVFLIGIGLYYMYTLDKYEFYIVKNEVLINKGSNYQVELLPKDSKYFDYLNYKYETEDPKVATVDKYGTITGVAPGETTLNIKYKNGITSKSMKVNIENIEIENIKINEELKLDVEDSSKIQVVVNEKEDLNTNVTYESSDPNILDIDEYGNVNTYDEGEVTVVVKADNGVSEEVVVDVKPQEVKIDDIKLNENNITIKKGTIYEFVPVIKTEEENDSTNYDLSWSSNNDNVEVDSTGTIIGNEVGESVVTVKTYDDKEADCVVNVVDESIDVDSITLNTTNQEMKVGESFVLIPTIAPQNATLRELIWTSSNPDVVMVEAGKLLAVSSGEATITVKTQSGKTATCKVIVRKNEIAVQKVSLNITNTTLNVGTSLKLNATVEPSNATSQGIEWSSSNNSIASIDEGVVLAKKVGTVTITAKTSNGQEATCTILIKDNFVSVTSIQLSQSSGTIKTGETLKLNATLEPSNASSKAIQWESSNEEVAVVDTTGLVTGLTKGETTITATSHNGNTSTAKIIVEAVVANDTIPPTATCKAVLENQKATITVTSNDTDIATYNYSGRETTKTNTYEAETYWRIPAKKLNTKASELAKVGDWDYYVIVTDHSGNSSGKITCEVTYKAKAAIKPKSGETLEYSASSKTLKVWVSQKNGFYISRVWAQNPVKQLNQKFAKYAGNSKVRNPKELLETGINDKKLQNKIVLGFNASQPSSVGGYTSWLAEQNEIWNGTAPIDLLLYNGEILMNSYKNIRANKGFVYIGADNKLSYVGSQGSTGVSYAKSRFQGVINEGSRNTFTYGSSKVIWDGKEEKLGSSSKTPRSSICQIDENNFIIISGGEQYVQALQNLMKSLGCKRGYNFDGGGSHALYFKKAGGSIQTVAGGKRSLSAVAYFTEL